MFFLIAGIAVTLILVTASLGGMRAAIATAWMLLLVLPSWMHRTVGAANLDLRFVVVTVALGLVIARISTGTWPRIVLSDLVVVTLMLSITTSRMLMRGPSPSWFLDTMNVWLLPYVFGRVLFATVRDYRSIAKYAAIVVCCLFVYAVIEVTFSFNPLHSMSGWSRWHSESYRFGIKRVEGTVTHPIYFGFAMLLLLPWSAYAWTLSRRNEAARWWQLILLMNLACIVLSGSRGAMIGAGIALLTLFVLRRPNRLLPGVVSLALCMSTVVYWGRVVDGLRYFAGESRSQETLIINGQEHAYSGTLHRIVQVKVYEKALMECGFFGFANVCSGENDPAYLRHVEYHLRDLFFSIDNHYLFFTLDCGYLGTALFIILGTIVIGYLLKPAAEAHSSTSVLAAAMAGSILGTMVMLWTVWLPTDFRFFFLCNCGMAASWRSRMAVTAGRLTRWNVAAHVPVIQPRLVPGHPSTTGTPTN